MQVREVWYTDLRGVEQGRGTQESFWKNRRLNRMVYVFKFKNNTIILGRYQSWGRASMCCSGAYWRSKLNAYQAALLSQSNMQWLVTCTLGIEVCGYCIVPEMLYQHFIAGLVFHWLACQSWTCFYWKDFYLLYWKNWKVACSFDVMIFTESRG